MNDTSLHPLEAILRLCEASGSEPWYPRWHAATAGLSLDRLKDQIEVLWLEGLIEHTPGTKETGPGLLLTPRGRQVLNDPEQLQRLREGRPLGGGDRAVVIRRAFLHPTRAYVTWLLLLANFAVFGYSAYLANQKHVLRPFLSYLPSTAPRKAQDQVAQGLQVVLRASGSVHPRDVIVGEWWRLAAANFVQFGLLHLLMNMYGLWVLGPFVEQMWGSIRFLIIYVIAGLGGICMGLAYNQPVENVGASGALCGLLGAHAVWLLLNGKCLPRGFARRGRVGLLTTVILLVIISLIPGVSGWGHLGGALFGAGAALLLQVQRFARRPLSWLAVGGLAPLCCLAVVMLDRARATSPTWERLEQADFEKRYAGEIYRELAESERAFHNDDVQYLLVNQHPKRRQQARVDKALAVLTDRQEHLQAFLNTLTRDGRYRNLKVLKRRARGLRQLEGWDRLLGTAIKCLRDKEDWPDLDQQGHREFEKVYLQRIHKAMREAARVYEKEVQPLLDQPAERRDAGGVRAALEQMAGQRAALNDLADALAEAGPYTDEDVDRGRQIGLAYAVAEAEGFELAERGLRAGKQWTEPEQQQQRQQRQRVAAVLKGWQAWKRKNTEPQGKDIP